MSLFKQIKHNNNDNNNNLKSNNNNNGFLNSTLSHRRGVSKRSLFFQG